MIKLNQIYKLREELIRKNKGVAPLTIYKTKNIIGINERRYVFCLNSLKIKFIAFNKNNGYFDSVLCELWDANGKRGFVEWSARFVKDNFVLL